MDLFYYHDKYSVDRWFRASCRRQSDVLLFVRQTLELQNCDNGNAMKQCNFQKNMVSLHRGRFVVVHLYSAFSLDPQNFSLVANLYQKLHFFASLGTVSPHFLSHNGKIWHEGVDLGLPPQAKFCKKKLIKGCTPFGQIYPIKIPIFVIFGAVSPHFKSDNGEIWHEDGAWHSLFHAKFCKN